MSFILVPDGRPNISLQEFFPEPNEPMHEETVLSWKLFQNQPSTSITGNHSHRRIVPTPKPSTNIGSI